MLFGAEVVIAAAALGLMAAGGYSYFSEPPPDVSTPMKDPNLQAEARKRGINFNGCYNFAIVGRSGVGKSTLRNRILGITKDTDPQAAKVSFEECTKIPLSAAHPQSKFVQVWDFPGVGTASQPSSTYFNKYSLYSYDTIILVSATRFMEQDILIAKTARSYNIPVFFVRNKVKHDTQNAVETMVEMEGKSEKEAIEMVSSRLKRELKEAINKEGFVAFNVYCIEARDLLNKHLDGEQLLTDVKHAMALYRRKVAK